MHEISVKLILFFRQNTFRKGYFHLKLQQNETNCSFEICSQYQKEITCRFNSYRNILLFFHCFLVTFSKIHSSFTPLCKYLLVTYTCAQKYILDNWHVPQIKPTLLNASVCILVFRHCMVQCLLKNRHLDLML